MVDIKLYCLIYELKGIVSSAYDMSQEDDRYDYPLIDSINNKMREIIDEISSKSEKGVSSEAPQTQLEMKTWGVGQVNAK